MRTSGTYALAGLRVQQLSALRTFIWGPSILTNLYAELWVGPHMLSLPFLLPLSLRYIHWCLGLSLCFFYLFVFCFGGASTLCLTSPELPWRCSVLYFRCSCHVESLPHTCPFLYTSGGIRARISWSFADAVHYSLVRAKKELCSWACFDRTTRRTGNQFPAA